MPDPVASRSRSTDLRWLDPLKGFAMAWIVLNHIVERLAGGAFAGNPDPAWPPLDARIAQFFALPGPGAAADVLAFLRDVGWLGDQGVTLFLIASGFGLAYGLCVRNVERVDAPAFFRARARRVYPLWLAAHAILLVALIVAMKPIGLPFLSSVLGIRFLPQTIYAYVPSWWYVGLLLQLYLVTPWLWLAIRRFGAARTLVAACALGFAARALGLLTLHAYLDPWSRGAIFVTRLPEFAFGMCLAVWYAADPAGVARTLRRPVWLATSAAAFVLGFASAFTLAGMTFAPFLMGAGAFALLLVALDDGRPHRALAAVGRHSYSIYLVHQPIVNALLPTAPVPSVATVAARIAVVVAFAYGAGLALEAAVDAIGAGLRRALARGAPAFVAGAAMLVILYGVLVGADLAIARFAPYEVNGWGERPSLVPDAAFGWKMIPSKTTRLRWTSYDYVVHANALGFPGADVAPAKPPGTLRVLVTGDAFTSGEGVGTADAWPSFLQADLEKLEGRNVQVLNFGMTGYGPDQEERVVRTFVPKFHPDVVVFESFVNAFEKLEDTDASIRADIGFGRSPGDGIAATLRLEQLRTFTIEGLHKLKERITGKPEGSDLFLSDARAFRRDDPDRGAEVAGYERRLRSASAAARAAGASFLLVMIPSRAQVCSATDFPRGAFLALTGPTYDPDRPQSDAARTAAKLGLPFLDLRGALNVGCPYQRANMHFVVSGDRLAASAVAAAIARRPIAGRD